MLGKSQKAAHLAEEITDYTVIQGRSLWQDARIRFVRNKAAMASVFILGLIVLFTIVGPYFAVWNNEEIDWNVMGDVRGMGLFIGVELVRPDGSQATETCSYVKNRMRDHRILIGSEGPRDNVLKIRPPLTIDRDGTDMIVTVLDEVLAEIAE